MINYPIDYLGLSTYYLARQFTYLFTWWTKSVFTLRIEDIIKGNFREVEFSIMICLMTMRTFSNYNGYSFTETRIK